MTARERSLRHTLTGPVLALALLTGVALAMLAWSTSYEARRIEAELSTVRQANALVFRVNELASDAQRNVLSYRFRPDERVAHAIAETDGALAELVREVAALDLPRRGRMLWREYGETRDGQLRTQAGLLEAIRAGDDAAVRPAFDKWDLTTGNAQALLADFTVYDERRLDRTVSELSSRRSRMLVVLLALLAAAVLVAVPFWIYVTRSVTRPLLAVSAVAQRVAREKVALSVEGADRGDEIGTLARAFNAMTEDLVHANAELKAALRMRDEFVSIASHELKTPLTALQLQLDGAARRLAAAGEAPPWLTSAQRQVRRLDVLVGQLLDVSRIRAGRVTLELSEVDLGAVAGAVAERLGPELERTGNTLQLDIAEGVTGTWDAGRIDQIVTNLLSNAAKYAPGSPVTLRVHSDARHRAVLEVEDRGAGVASDLRERLFEPFERGTKGRSFVSGLGLGLYIVRQIVEAHGGYVRLEDPPDGGARFVVELPLAPASVAGKA